MLNPVHSIGFRLQEQGILLERMSQHWMNCWTRQGMIQQCSTVEAVIGLVLFWHSERIGWMEFRPKKLLNSDGQLV